MRHQYGETVQHVLFDPGTEDTHGNVTPGYLPPYDVPYVGVAPTATEENIATGERVEDRITLYLEPEYLTTSVDPRDRFIVRGKTYNVQGSFLNWVSPFDGRNQGGTIYLERMTG